MAFFHFNLRRLFHRVAEKIRIEDPIADWSAHHFNGWSVKQLFFWLYRHRIQIEMMLDEDERLDAANAVRESGTILRPD